MDDVRGLLRLNGGQLAYEAVGDGVPVVFLHGFGLDLRMWTPQVEGLRSSHRVIRYDLRGFGCSSLPPTTSYAHEYDLARLLDDLRASPAHVVGLSMGGRMALRFALAHPSAVRSLVLASSAVDGQARSAAWDDRWNAICIAAKSGDIAGAKRLWLAHPLFDPARADATRAALLANMIEDYSGWHWHNTDPVARPDPPLSQRLAEIRTPTLIVTGEYDLPDYHACADILAQNLPAARRLVVRHAGHMVNLEAPTEFNEALVAFWQAK